MRVAPPGETAVKFAAPFALLAALAADPEVPPAFGQSLGDAAPRTVTPYRTRGAVVYTDLPPKSAKRLADAVGDAVAAGAALFGTRRFTPVNVFAWDDTTAWPVEQLPNGPKFAMRGGGTFLQTNSMTNSQGYSVLGVTVSQQSRTDRSAAFWGPAAEGKAQRGAVIGLAATVLEGAPQWYLDGAAELARYHRPRETAVRIDPADLAFLTTATRPPLAAAVADPDDDDAGAAAVPWRWALAHLAAHNPNFRDRYALLGPALANEQPVTFAGAFGPVGPQLAFEWDQFLDHMQQGLRPDLTAWEWSAKARALGDGRTYTARIDAGRGWQPAQVAVEAGDPIAYAADGTWTVGPDESRSAADDPLAEPDPDAAREARRRRDPGPDLPAAGGEDGRGRLVAAIFDPDLLTLSDEIELGPAGRFTAPATGRLMLRCRDAWGQLDDNRGRLTVKLRRHDPDRPL